MDATTKVTIVLLLFAAIAVAVVIWAYFTKKNQENKESGPAKIGPRNGPATASSRSLPIPANFDELKGDAKRLKYYLRENAIDLKLSMEDKAARANTKIRTKVDQIKTKVEQRRAQNQ